MISLPLRDCRQASVAKYSGDIYWSREVSKRVDGFMTLVVVECVARKNCWLLCRRLRAVRRESFAMKLPGVLVAVGLKKEVRAVFANSLSVDRYLL